MQFPLAASPFRPVPSPLQAHFPQPNTPMAPMTPMTPMSPPQVCSLLQLISSLLNNSDIIKDMNPIYYLMKKKYTQVFLAFLLQIKNCPLKLKCVIFQHPVGCPSRSMYLTPHSPRMASAAGMQQCPQRTPQHPMSPTRVPQLNSPHTPQVTLQQQNLSYT